LGIYKSDILDLRKNIEDNKGQRIIVKESPGKRSKPQEKAAIIENTYKDYFRVKFEDVERVGSYNYTDLFTRSIEVSLYDGQEFQPILPPPVETKRTKTVEVLDVEAKEENTVSV